MTPHTGILIGMGSSVALFTEHVGKPYLESLEEVDLGNLVQYMATRFNTTIDDQFPS
jgi:hypothetical protein